MIKKVINIIKESKRKRQRNECKEIKSKSYKKRKSNNTGSKVKKSIKKDK